MGEKLTSFREKYRIESARLKHWDYSSAGYYFITICTKDKDNLFGEIENREMILNNFGKNTEKQWQKSFRLRQELQCDEYIIMPDHIHAIIIITENPTSVETHGVRLKNKPDVNDKNDIIPVETHGVRLKNKPGINHKNDPIPVNSHGVRLKNNPDINDGDACHASLQYRRQEQDPKIFRRPKSVSSFVAGFKSSVTRIYNEKNNTKGRAIWQPRFHDRVIRNEMELQKIRDYIKTNPIKWEQNHIPVETHGVRLKNKHDINHKNDIIPADSHGVRFKNKYTIPDKPNSRLQKYRLTEKGKKIVGGRGKTKKQEDK